jgi:hypothetical protein
MDNEEDKKIDKSYFNLCKRNLQFFTVDEITIEDLSLDKIFSKLDLTVTTPGESVLYFQLRNQCTNEAQLETRFKPVHFFLQNPEKETAIKKILQKIGKQKNGDLSEEIWNNTGDHYMKYKNLYFGWILIMAASIGTCQ